MCYFHTQYVWPASSLPLWNIHQALLHPSGSGWDEHRNEVVARGVWLSVGLHDAVSVELGERNSENEKRRRGKLIVHLNKENLMQRKLKAPGRFCRGGGPGTAGPLRPGGGVEVIIRKPNAIRFAASSGCRMFRQPKDFAPFKVVILIGSGHRSVGSLL